MKSFTLCFCLSVIMLVTGACSNAQAPSVADSSDALTSPLRSPLAMPIETPAAGVAAVTGVILAEGTGAPIGGVSVHLAEVFRKDGEAAYILNTATSPSTVTDAAGQFAIINIPAREYVVIIGDPSASYAILTEPGGTAKVWNAEPGKILDLGIQRVTLR